MKDFLISKGVRAEKIQFANYGTDPVPFNVNSQKPLVYACYVGRLVENKGILDLVAIWKEVVVELPHAKLAIVGGGSDMDRLVRLTQTEHLQ